MDRRRWILLLLLLVLLAVGGALLWRRWQTPTTPEDSAQQAIDQAAAVKAAWFNTPDRLLLFLSLNDGGTTMYGLDAYTRTMVELNITAPTLFSNYLPASQHWYSVVDQTLTKHAPDGDTAVGTLSQLAVPTDTTGFEPALAVDATEQYMVWLSRKDYTESVRLFDLTTGADTELYQGEPNIHYGNFTFSPNSTEIAFTANDTKIITLTLEGAEIHTPINVPFHEFHSLAWITLNEFGAVITSTDANPEPFNPTVAVINRSGEITERHDAFEKVGIPRVLWSADGSQFMFHHPWRNTFYIYDRYDQLVQQIGANAPGKLIPFGYVDGLSPTFGATDTTTPPIDNTSADETSEPFVASADDWEHYNSIERSIVQQWAVDLDTYRFTTDDQGLYVSFAYTATATEPAELVFIQTILQTFAVLPNIPAITVVMSDSTGNTLLEAEAVTVETARSVVDSMLHLPLEQLFVINKRHPIGQRTTKPENSNYHLVGDLVYSKFGDYNPQPVLALLGVQPNNARFYANSAYTLLVPNSLSNQLLPDDTVLFYSPETEFVSTTAWTQFGITVKPYDAPGITLDQWLSVNRADNTAEAPTFASYEPIEIKHLVNTNTFTDEYAVLAQNKVYLLTLQRDSGITEVDRTLFTNLVQSMSFFYAIQR